MKYSEIKDLTVEELKKKSRELREGVFQAKMKNSLGQLNNPLEIRQARKDIARIESAINQKTN